MRTRLDLVVLIISRCTSCSVPLVYKKASLLAKDPRTGAEVPWDPNPEATWIDGSVDNDLPMTRLAEMFNVNHFIVSQVNPHVVPFLAKEEEIIAAEAQQDVTAGRGWMSISTSLCKGEVMHRLQQLADTGFLPNLVTKGRSVLSQRYSGDINIFPKINYADFPRVLSNPTPEYMVGCMLTGQRATWPRLSRIQNHVAIELALDDTIQKLKGRLVFISTTYVPSPMRSTYHGNDLTQRKRAKSTNKMTRFEQRTDPPSPLLRNSAPTSPMLSRVAPMLSRKPSLVPSQAPLANHLKRRILYVKDANVPATDTISSSDDSSDRDYFADPDSDSTERVPSPSPSTSPTFQVPALWPSTSQAIMRATSQPPTPTAADIRTGTLLNLAMTSATSAALSSPELRYKRLFHPPGPATSDVSVGEPVLRAEGANISPYASKPGSRRGSGAGMPLDYSGTRGMLLRKKSYM
jgi:TAG lipase/steryl ester hydrolase/phospholipase A2/LPA acyltransferase